MGVSDDRPQREAAPGSTCAASRTAVYGDGVRGRLRQRKRIAAGLAVALRLLGFTLTVP